jgi:sulfur carrier protein ThiS
LCQVCIKQTPRWEFCGFQPDGRIWFEGANLVNLVLRNKEYEVKAGMTLLAALQKINVLPESVIATRDGEMILEDEILKDGDLIKLIAVISGGSYHCEERSDETGTVCQRGEQSPTSEETLAPGASAGVASPQCGSQ